MRSLTFTLLFFLLTSSVFATQDRKTLKLRLQSPSGNLCDATLYFDQGISAAYDIHEDAQMVFNNVPGVPELYSFTTDNVPCSINGCGTLSAPASVALGYHVGYNGLYTISAVQMNNFDPTTIIRLVDKQLGTAIDLRENFYQIQLDSSDLSSGRFSIMVSTPVQYSSQNANCSNNSGSITVTPDSSIAWSMCQLFDSTNHVLVTDTNVTGQITFNGLSAGSYHVVFTYNQYNTVYDFYLNGNYVVASIGVPGPKIYTNEDVIFNGIATNANHFTWDFGDGTLIDGVDNPDQTYLVPGTYTVHLTCSNDLGCTASATATVIVYLPTGVNDPGKKDNITMIALGKTVTVKMNDVTLSSSPEISVYNLLGQAIITQPLSATEQIFDLSAQPTGYYLISVKNGGTVNTKRVFLGQ